MIIENLPYLYSSNNYCSYYTLFLKQHITCKAGLENYLNEIYNIIEAKCQQIINNYNNVLSRNDEGKNAFGLKNL